MKASSALVAAAMCVAVAIGASVRGGDSELQTRGGEQLSAGDTAWAPEAAVSAADAPRLQGRAPAFHLTVNCPSTDDDKSAKDASFLP